MPSNIQFATLATDIQREIPISDILNCVFLTVQLGTFAVTVHTGYPPESEDTLRYKIFQSFDGWSLLPYNKDPSYKRFNTTDKEILSLVHDRLLAITRVMNGKNEELPRIDLADFVANLQLKEPSRSTAANVQVSLSQQASGSNPSRLELKTHEEAAVGPAHFVVVEEPKAKQPEIDLNQLKDILEEDGKNGLIKSLKDTPKETLEALLLQAVLQIRNNEMRRDQNNLPPRAGMK